MPEQWVIRMSTMKFMSIREVQQQGSTIKNILANDGKIIITHNGKPIGFTVGVNENTLEDLLDDWKRVSQIRQLRAMDKNLQKQKSTAPETNGSPPGEEGIGNEKNLSGEVNAWDIDAWNKSNPTGDVDVKTEADPGGDVNYWLELQRDITLKKAAVEDAPLLYEMQIKAFKPLLEKYQDFNTNPGAEIIERTIHRLKEQNSHYYFILLADIRIGAIRVLDNGDLCRLKQIYILPEYQGYGYAQQAILLVEMLHKNARNWELDTIKQESKLCHLYEKMGYKQTGKEERVKDGMTIVFYKKLH